MKGRKKQKSGISRPFMPWRSRH